MKERGSTSATNARRGAPFVLFFLSLKKIVLIKDIKG